MLGLNFREQLPPIVAAELDALIARLQPLLNVNTATTAGASTSITDIIARLLALELAITSLSAGVARVDAGQPGIPGMDGMDSEADTWVVSPAAICNINFASSFLFMS